MQALVLNEDRDRQVAISVALMRRGFLVVTADCVEQAMAYADLGVVDLLVISERAGGRLSHAVALAAELRNPAVTTLMLTARADPDVDELFELVPSLHGLLGPDLAPGLIARLACAGVAGRATVQARGVLQRAAERAAGAEHAADAMESGAGNQAGNQAGIGALSAAGKAAPVAPEAPEAPVAPEAAFASRRAGIGPERQTGEAGPLGAAGAAPGGMLAQIMARACESLDAKPQLAGAGLRKPGGIAA